MNLNLDSFKSSGVYTLEIDNTAMDIQTTDSLRLAVGFTAHPPFNRPVYLSNKADKEKIFGKGCDTKLERRGSFFDRSLEILLSSQPVIALNLLKTSEQDKVGTTSFAMSCKDAFIEDKVDEVRYDEFFDRTRFWVPSKDHLNQVNAAQFGNVGRTELNEKMYMGPIFNVVNIGTNDITVFALKDNDIAGYNITAAKWYENDTIPYSWIRPTDYMSDFFVKLVAVKGDWSNFEKLSLDTTWQKYFDNKGLKLNELDNFMRADGVSLIGTWSGCILPNFYAKNGNLVSIEDKVNKYAEQTGVMISFNAAAMEALVNSNDEVAQLYDENWDGEFNETLKEFGPAFQIDMVGHFGKTDMISLLSYAPRSAEDKIKTINVNTSLALADNEFAVDGSANSLTLGSFVEGKDGYLLKIVNKKYKDNCFIYTVSGAVNINKETDEEGNVSATVNIHTAYNDFFEHLQPRCLKGLKISNRHMPGFAEDGTANMEEGVEKIYSMLVDDEGINRGLKNRLMINFRYIIDTMAGGLSSGLGGKEYLFRMAKEVGKCTALVNFPSVQQMSMSADPLFCDMSDSEKISKTFSTDYIPTGGNKDALCSTELTLPTKDEGADYGLVFSPFLKYRSGSRTILIPPAAHVANAYIRKFNGGNPYGIVANRDGILGDSDVVGVEYMYDSKDRDNLEPTGINPIIDDNGEVMIYGNRTAYQEVLSDLNYAHVRELLNTIEIQCEDVLKKYVFKYNNEVTRAEIVRRLDPILEEKLASGALYSYNIVCNSDNNTSEIINRAFGIVDIEVVCTKGMEKIIQRIHLNKLSE